MTSRSKRRSRFGSGNSRSEWLSAQRLRGRLLGCVLQFAPEMALRVNADQRLLDPTFPAEFIDRLAAIGPRRLAVIVDDRISADRQFIVEIYQPISGRLVVVAIQSQNRERFDRGIRKRILEPPFKEPNLFVEHPVGAEVSLNFLKTCRIMLVGLRHNRPPMSFRFKRELLGVGLRQPFEGISHPYGPIRGPISL